MKYLFIEQNRSEFPVKRMCHVLEVFRSGYSGWRGRLPSRRQLNKDALKESVRDCYLEAHDGMAGSPTIAADLRAEGKWPQVSRTRVATVMKEMGLRCGTQKKWIQTTDSEHSLPVAPNILDRNFTVAAPNLVWVSDITYLRMGGRWMYLCVFIDLFARRVVGWSLAESMHASHVTLALHRAVAWRKPGKGLIVHSDRGVQYASIEMRQELAKIGSIQSMSRKGNCWDNAVAESFFHLLKSRLTNHKNYATEHELMKDLFIYIEGYYNRKRRHSTNGWMTPDQFEANFWKRTA